MTRWSSTVPRFFPSQTVVLSKSVSGTLVVVDQDSTSRPKLQAALRSLTLVEAKLLGVVINKIAPQNTSAFDYRLGDTPRWKWPDEELIGSAGHSRKIVEPPQVAPEELIKKS